MPYLIGCILDYKDKLLTNVVVMPFSDFKIDLLYFHNQNIIDAIISVAHSTTTYLREGISMWIYDKLSLSLVVLRNQYFNQYS